MREKGIAEGASNDLQKQFCPWREIMRPDSHGRLPAEWLASSPILETIEMPNNPGIAANATMRRHGENISLGGNSYQRC